MRSPYLFQFLLGQVQMCSKRIPLVFDGRALLAPPPYGATGQLETLDESNPPNWGSNWAVLGIQLGGETP